MDGIVRILSSTDPLRAYGATHRLYGGSLAGDVTLSGSYGTLDVAGNFVHDQHLEPWSRHIIGAELGALIAFASATDAVVAAAPTPQAKIEALRVGYIGDFLDHDNRWGGPPAA